MQQGEGSSGGWGGRHPLYPRPSCGRVDENDRTEINLKHGRKQGWMDGSMDQDNQVGVDLETVSVTLKTGGREEVSRLKHVHNK